MKYRIKENRNAMNLTQEQLSKKSGVSRTIIAGLESGKITVTSTGTLKKIASALEKNVSEIFFD